MSCKNRTGEDYRVGPAWFHYHLEGDTYVTQRTCRKGFNQGDYIAGIITLQSHPPSPKTQFEDRWEAFSTLQPSMADAKSVQLLENLSLSLKILERKWGWGALARQKSWHSKIAEKLISVQCDIQIPKINHMDAK